MLAGIPGNHQVIFVDDASPDDSWKVIRDIISHHPDWSAIQLMKNYGQHQATLVGLRHARGDFVLTMDDDLQHDPAHITELVKVLREDTLCDAVFAYFPEKQHSLYRNIGSNAIRWVNSRAYGGKASIRTSSYRLMRAPIARAISSRQIANPAISALILSCTSRIKSIPVRHDDRFAGKSNYTLAKQFRLAFDNISSVSMLPLRVISMLGIITACFSCLLTAYFFIRYVTGYTGVAGWTTLVILISFFAGMTLLALGVIGEYIVRVLREVTRVSEPPIRESIGSDLKS